MDATGTRSSAELSEVMEREGQVVADARRSTRKTQEGIAAGRKEED